MNNVHMNNVEFVSSLMSYGSPMNQMIVICAIENYLKAVESAKPEDVENGLISGEAWIAACNDLRKKFNERYK